MLNNHSLAIKKALFYKGYSFFFLIVIVFGLLVIYSVAFTSISIQQKFPESTKDFWTNNLGMFKDEKFVDPIKKQNYLSKLSSNTTYFQVESVSIVRFGADEDIDVNRLDKNVWLVHSPSLNSIDLQFIPDKIFDLYSKTPKNLGTVQILSKPSLLNSKVDIYSNGKLVTFVEDREQFNLSKIWNFEVGYFLNSSSYDFVGYGDKFDTQIVGLPIGNIGGGFRESQKSQILNIVSKYGNVQKEIKTYILYPDRNTLMLQSQQNPDLKIDYIASDQYKLELEIKSYELLFAIIAGFLGIVNLGIIYFIFNKFLKLNTSYNQLLYILGYSRLQVVGFNALLLSIYAGISSLVAFGLALLVAKISFPSIDSIILGIFGRDFNNPYFVFELALNNTIWAWIFGINFVLFGSLFAMCYFKISKKYVMQS